ncbi:MAG: hypothetical protein IJ242_06365 [Clostridia bacterium]|nr:hypothetical protein [Clostridia bacterium]
MKTNALLFLLLVCICLFLPVCADSPVTTVMIYLCGSGLANDACDDLIEMAEVEAGDTINLLVLAGGVDEWPLEDLEGGTRNLALIRDGYFELMEDWGSKSMGSEESLLEFLRYGMTEYPSDRTIVILWNHGAGSEGGLCFDDSYDGDGLTLTEIDSALHTLSAEQRDFHIDIFGADACLMATYEMAAMLSFYNIDCYVASEETEPSLGWNYTPWLNAILENPGISNEELCKSIAQSYMKSTLLNDPDEFATISAVRLNSIRELTGHMESFASSLSEQIRSGRLADVRRGRSRLYTFGSYQNGWDMVDLGAALDQYATLAPEETAAARRLLSQSVIVNLHTKNLSDCSGLSVYIPQDSTDDYVDFRDGFNLSHYLPNWIAFLDEYVHQVQNGTHVIASTSPQQVQPTSGLLSSLLAETPVLSWDALSGSYETSPEPSGEQIETSDGKYGFTTVVSKEDLQYLDYVEGMLMLDISDEDGLFYVDFGVTQNNRIDWQTGRVLSLFDGTLPLLDGQIVPLYDQTRTEYGRRSLIPVKLNGEYTYLIAVFEGNSKEGRIIGANAGYDENGLPIRNMDKLSSGDVIIPVYTMFYGDLDSDEDLEETEFEGDKIIWRDGMTVTYEDMQDEDEPMEILFCFAFNDIFGDYTLSDMISFEL